MEKVIRLEEKRDQLDSVVGQFSFVQKYIDDCSRELNLSSVTITDNWLDFVPKAFVTNKALVFSKSVARISFVIKLNKKLFVLRDVVSQEVNTTLSQETKHTPGQRVSDVLALCPNVRFLIVHDYDEDYEGFEDRLTIIKL